MIIQCIETLSDPAGSIPALTFVRVHTSSGLIGLGETFYTPQTVHTYVHEILAPQLIGRAALGATGAWDDLYRQVARRGAGGTDIRALSAVDLALWDLKGKALGVPVHVLLGGTAQPAGPQVYNTCAGATYATGTTVGKGPSSQDDDLWRVLNDPGPLAAELLHAGYGGMKLWPFDAAALLNDGRTIDHQGLEAGVQVLASIREAVGPDIEIMLEGHGQWDVGAATRILRAVEQYDVLWAEDIVLAHDPRALKALSRSTSVPLAASEYLMGRWQYRQVLEAEAIGYLHLDPSWCGGITESRHVLSLASSFGVTACMHDCTGPVNLLAGLHLATVDVNVAYQEVLRAFLDEVYPHMVDTTWATSDGRLAAPERPGLGAELTEQYLSSPTLVRQVSSA